MKTVEKKALPLGIITGLVLTQILVLRWQGRIGWCACKRWTIWVGDTWSSHNSQHLLDPYTFSHILHGVIFCGFFWLVIRGAPVIWRLVASIAVEVLWEIAENSTIVIERYREATAALGYSGDSIVNSVSDVGCCAFGFMLARIFGWRLSVAFCVIVEVAMLLVYRDNLTLNVLMLLYPIDAIKHWQVGT